MSQLTSNQRNKRHGSMGRGLLWLAIVLSVALLGFVTALAIRNNPLYSDAATNGISKYKFIEFCKDKMTEQLDAFAKQPGGAKIDAAYNARDIVSSVSEGVQPQPAAGATSLPARVPGWSMVSQVKLSREGFASQTVPFACQYEKGKEVQLNLQPQQ
ncbi:hypothetical protein [Deinococcus irradiatisoli]|nr:hypothetical protein [Deinococcus irradiatisoli]